MVGTVAELDQGRRRSVEVRVKLSPALAEEFSTIAEGRGLLPATLAATALGEYVERHRQQAVIARLVALDASKRMAASMSDPEAMAKVMAAALANPGVIEAFSTMASEGA
jgi:predicted transcriptional regulator